MILIMLSNAKYTEHFILTFHIAHVNIYCIHALLKYMSGKLAYPCLQMSILLYLRGLYPYLSPLYAAYIVILCEFSI